MSATYDVIVAGVGTMGSAASMALARRGVRVLGIDRFSPPHGRGSHHGKSRIFRLAYYEHPDYVPLLQRAQELWKGLEREQGERLLVETGVLYMGPRESELVSASARSAERHGVECELLGREELARRFPQFVVPGDFVGLREPRAGMLLAEPAVAGMVRAAEMRGARIARGERVVSWEADGRGVRVRTDRGEASASALIVTAGAWVPELVRDLGVRLEVTRQPFAWFVPPDPGPFRAPEAGGDGFPCWAIAHADGSLHYGFPLLEGAEAELKVAHHKAGAACDPEDPGRGLAPEEEADLRRVLREHIPGADGALRRGCVCMYTNTPDSHFVIDRHPAHANVVVASACSGHGFKFAPVIGEALADLALEGRTGLPIGFLGLSRFGGGP